MVESPPRPIRKGEPTFHYLKKQQMHREKALSAILRCEVCKRKKLYYKRKLSSVYENFVSLYGDGLRTRWFARLFPLCLVPTFKHKHSLASRRVRLLPMIPDVVNPSNSSTGAHCTGFAIDTGDTTWVLISTILVMGMLPALAFFEAGMLRSKNTLSIITQIIGGFITLTVMWDLFGYSLTFSPVEYVVSVGYIDYHY